MPHLINNQNLNQPESLHIVKYVGVSYVATFHALWLVYFFERVKLKK